MYKKERYGFKIMIKIFSGVYIHFITILLFSVCYITGKLETLFITYVIMFLHELSHLLVALAIGLKPSHIVFYPFGVNLKLKNKLVPSIADEIILYMIGPFSNIIMEVLAKLFLRDFFWFEDFYFKNIMLFFINLLPILPLDGGVVLKKILTYSFGYNKSVRIVRLISVLMVFLGCVCLFKFNMLRYNFSMYFFLIFLVGNLFTAKEKYNLDILKELMFSDKKILCRKTKVLVAKKDENLREILKDFTNTHYNIVCVIGENGEIEKMLSQKEVINTLLAK